MDEQLKHYEEIEQRHLQEEQQIINNMSFTTDRLKDNYSLFAELKIFFCIIYEYYFLIKIKKFFFKMSSFELGKYYSIQYSKNREGSNQLRLNKHIELTAILLREIAHPRTCFKKVPFWIHGEDVWLEVHQSTNLPKRVDQRKVVFTIDNMNRVFCHFKKMEPFNLSHYISPETTRNLDAALDELEGDAQLLKEKNIPRKVIKKQRENLNAVCFWTDHPSSVSEKKITQLLDFYKSIYPLKQSIK